MYIEHEPGTCPNCGLQSISYSDVFTSRFSNGLWYNATCNNCGTTYEEWYDIKFGGLYDIEIHNNLMED